MLAIGQPNGPEDRSGHQLRLRNIYQLLSATQARRPRRLYLRSGGNRPERLTTSVGATTLPKNSLAARVSYTFDNNGNELTKVRGGFGHDELHVGLRESADQRDAPEPAAPCSFPTIHSDGESEVFFAGTATSIFAYDGDTREENKLFRHSVAAMRRQPTLTNHRDATWRSNRAFNQTDGLGSISSLTNASGAVAQTYTTIRLVRRLHLPGHSPTIPVYGSRVRCGSGLYFLRNRYYDPQSGRFLNEDPLGLPEMPIFYATFKTAR